MARSPSDRTLGPAYAVRLGDLRPWHAIEARCFECRHVGRLTSKTVKRLLAGFKGEFTPVLQLQRRLRCRECGNRHLNTLSIVMLERNM
jgi:hypothetical protein